MESENASDQRRKQFGGVLNEALTVRAMKQSDLAEAVGTTQSAVSAWITGKSEPGARTVFLVETALDVSPGYLSIILGYIPPSAKNVQQTPEEQVAHSTTWTEDSKKVILSVMRTLASKDRAILSLTRTNNEPAAARSRRKTGSSA